MLVDEELAAFRHKLHTLPKNHRFITDFIGVEQVNPTYSRVVVLDDDELQEIGRNKQGDDLYAVIAETVRIITNQHWDTFVNLEQYEKLKSGKVKRLAFHSILTSSVVEDFGSVFMTCANFEDTALYRLWSRRDNTMFKKHKTFANGLRFTEHSNGHLLTISYATDQAWSRKRLQTLVGTDEKATYELVASGAMGLFNGSSFLWQANKSQDNPFGHQGYQAAEQAAWTERLP
jgi:hypothetical protein